MHPVVIERYLEDGETIEVPTRARSGNGTTHTAEERALVSFLDEYFPERRKRRRADA